MNYRLSVEDKIYPVEDINLPSGFTFAKDFAHKLVSFVSPIRLPIGESCLLLGDSVDYQLLVNTCMGFTYSQRFLVSGIIAPKEQLAPSEGNYGKN